MLLINPWPRLLVTFAACRHYVLLQLHLLTSDRVIKEGHTHVYTQLELQFYYHDNHSRCLSEQDYAVIKYFVSVEVNCFCDYWGCIFDRWLNYLVVQFYVGFCSKSGTLVAQIASCQCLCFSSSAVG